MKSIGVAFLIWLLVAILAVVGEIKCIVKACKCDWEPIGKAEIIYTASACCGLGVVVGWINIEDTPKPEANTEKVSMNTAMPVPVYLKPPRTYYAVRK